MELDLISSDISNLLDVEEDLSDVVILNLHGNGLCSLYGLVETSKLVELNLSSNAFTSCDLPELVYLPCLKALDLSGNRIVSLEGLPFLPSVSSLAVSFNAIRSLDGIFNFPNLEVVDCRGNLLSCAQDLMHIQPLGRLRELWLSSSDGRYSNPICAKAGEVVRAFDETRYFGVIDGKDRQRWTVDVMPTASFTPKFDMVAKRFLSSAGSTRSQTSGLAGDLHSQYSLVEEERSRVGVGCDLSASSGSDDEDTEGNLMLKGRVCGAMLSAAHRRWALRWLHRWSRTASYLTGQVTERALAAAVAHQQACALEEVIADEAQKNRSLEEAIDSMKADADRLQQQHSSELATAKRLAESERDRSEQLRVQLLKHVAISNTQNAELQKSRQMCANLEKELKKSADTVQNSDSVVEQLRADLERALAQAQAAGSVAAEAERDLRERVGRLELDLRSMAAQLDASQAENSDLSKQLIEAHNDLASSEESYRNLQSKFEGVGMELGEARQMLQERDDEVQALRIGAADTALMQQSSDGRLRAAEAEVRRLGDDLEQARGFAAEQKASLDDLCAIVMDLKSTLKKNHARCKHVEAQRDKLREQVAELSDQRLSDSSRVDEEKRQLKQQFSVAMEALQSEARAVRAEKAALEKDLARALSAAQALQSAAAAEKHGQGRAELRVEEMQHALRVKDKMLDDQRDLISELRGRLGVESEEARLRVADAESQCESAQDEIAALQRQLRASAKVERELRQLVSDLRGGRGDSEEEEDGPGEGQAISAALRGDNVQIKAEIAALHQALALKNKHLESAQLELRDLADALAHLKEKISSIQKEAETAKSDRDVARSDVKRLEDSVAELTSNLSVSEVAMQSIKQQYEQELAAMILEKEQLKSRVAEAQAEATVAKESNKKFKEAFSALSSLAPM